MAARAFLLFGLFAGNVLASDLPTPGLYEVTMEMESDMPMPVGPQTLTECYTQQAFEQDPRAFLGAQDGSGDNCQIADYSMADGEMFMDMLCDTAAGQMTMVSRGTYDATSFSFRSEMQIMAQGTTMKMTATNQGTRVGDCGE